LGHNRKKQTIEYLLCRSIAINFRALREKFTTQFSLSTKLTLTVTLTLSDTVKLTSQTKLGGELFPERPIFERLWVDRRSTAIIIVSLNIVLCRVVSGQVTASDLATSNGHAI